MDNHMVNNKKWNTLRVWLLTAVAIMLVVSAIMGTAWAYFTTYTRAKGGLVLHLGHEEESDESFREWNKIVNLSVKEGSKPVYLRAKAFCADYDLTLSSKLVENDGDGPDFTTWEQGDDGWMYYKKVVPFKDDEGNTSYTAEPLYVRINNVPQEKYEVLEKSDTFNVIIVYEATEVIYGPDGKPLPWNDKEIDWTKKVDKKRTTATSSGMEESSDSGSTTDAGGEE